MDGSAVGLVRFSDEWIDAEQVGVFHAVLETLRSTCLSPLLKVVVLKSPDDVTEAEAAELKSLSIVLGDPRTFTNKVIFDHLHNLEWLQIFYAGVDFVVEFYRNKPRPKFALTRAEGHYDIQMAEYVLGFIIYRERQFQQFQDAQSKRKWDYRTNFRILSSLIVGIVGFGNIGKKLAEIALKFDAKTIAYLRKNSTEKEKALEGVEVTYDLSYLLESSDYIISILPKVPTTDGFFDGDVFKSCKKKPVFVNIGRGNCVMTETIIAALDNGWLSHAILDVFEKEPLPEDSPLWARDDVTITPHISGTCFDAKRFCKAFEQNYKSFCEGKPLNGLVDWDKGY